MQHKLTEQQAAVVEWLRSKWLTQDQAKEELGVARLSARVAELNGMGYRITKEMIVVQTRRKPTYVARYELKGEPPAAPTWSEGKPGDPVPTVTVPPASPVEVPAPSDLPLPDPKRKLGVDVIDDQATLFRDGRGLRVQADGKLVETKVQTGGTP